MNGVAVDQSGVNTGLDCFQEDLLEPFGTPALPNPCQGTVVGKFLVKPESGKPADCKIDLRFPHELAVMDNALKETGQHQPNRRFRVNTRPSVCLTIQVGHFPAKP